jgi:Methyltransferase domain.
MKKFPIESESIDVVFANQVIEHLINIDNFVSETYRVLKRGLCDYMHGKLS